MHYALLARHADGRVEAAHDVHREGVFPRARWLALLDAAGFDAAVEVDEWAREVFVCRLR